MLEDTIKVGLMDNSDKKITSISLYLYDEAEENPQKIKIVFDKRSYIADNYFDALILLRKDLESESMQLMCNGAAMEVYPSSMQLDMGCCRTGYVLHMSKPALNKDIVDLFEFDETLTLCDIKTQEEYYNKWLLSLKK